MPSKYWIKLYQEVLEDPKMGRLPDNLWRRSIELFLLAGELGSDLKEEDRGHLPATGEIAWRLRQPEEGLEAELHQLAEIGILTQTDTGWLVTNFVKRQEYVKPAQRMKQYRERKRDKELNTIIDQDDKEMNTRSVTHRNAEIESDKEIESTSKEVGDLSPPPLQKSEPKPVLSEVEGLEQAEPEVENLPPIPRRSRAVTIPAIQVFVDITGKFVLNSTQIKEIDERVGRDPPALDKWRETVKAWQLAGNKINNVSGMLDWFKKGIPVYAQKEIKNGHYSSSQNNPVTDPAGQAGSLSRVSAQVSAALKGKSRGGRDPT